MQDLTPDDSKSAPNSAASTRNSVKGEETKPKEAYNSSHRSNASRTPPKEDTKVPNNARSLTPSSAGTEEIVRGIKVVRIPVKSNKRGEKRSNPQDRPKFQQKSVESSDDEWVSPKKATSSQSRLHPRGRAITRQSQSSKRSDSDRSHAEARQTYDRVLEDAAAVLDSAEEARRELRRCRLLSEDVRAFAAKRATPAHRDETDANVPECQFSYIVCF